MQLLLETCAALCAAINPVPPTTAPDDPVPAAATGTIAPPANDLSPAAMLDDRELAEQRGGQTIVVANQTMVSAAVGNVLNGDYSAGAVTLSDNALQGFNGIGNLLINTGAQVSLQTGMNLTINLTNP